MSRFRVLFCTAFFVVFTLSCNNSVNHLKTETAGIPVTRIPLSGVAAQPDAEFSSLAWYGEKLVLMAENPESFDDHHFFSLEKSDIESFINNPAGGPPPISSIRVIGDFSAIVSGYEGFEALTFIGNRAFLTIEAHSDTGMIGWVVSGTMNADGGQLKLDTSRRGRIPVPGNIRNYSAEALTAYQNELVAFYEANGKNVNIAPVAYRFDTNLNYLGTFAMPAIEYRITDACATDSTGTFWLMNYFYPPEIRKLNPTDDIFAEGGKIKTKHPVERLLRMEFKNGRIAIADSNALNILTTTQTGRNWEGLVRLDDKGFLIVTDQYPETILAFVPFPPQ